MKPVEEYSIVAQDIPLFFWQGYDPKVKYDCSSSAIVTEEGLIFIDPIALTKEALEGLLEEAGTLPKAIVLTSGNHQRDSLLLAAQKGVPIYAPHGAGEDIIADFWYTPGMPVVGLQTFSLRGFGPGEAALFYQKGEKKILIIGDALIPQERELSLLPKKYCENFSLAKASWQALQELAPTHLLLAHGLPITIGYGETGRSLGSRLSSL